MITKNIFKQSESPLTPYYKANISIGVETEILLVAEVEQLISPE